MIPAVVCRVLIRHIPSDKYTEKAIYSQNSLIIMRVVELKEDLTVKDWLQTANVKPNTEKSYLQGMQEYTEFTGKAPKTILEEAEADIQKGLLMRQRRIKSELIGFRAHLQESGIAEYSIKNRLVGVKSFFRTFDIEIPKLPRTNKAVPLEKNLRIPEKEDLQGVLKVADPLERAVILVEASSGLAANELCNLRISVPGCAGLSEL